MEQAQARRAEIDRSGVAPPAAEPQSGVAQVLLLGVVVFACYGRVLTMPLVQDDWGLLTELRQGSFLSVVAHAFSPRGQLFFRPLGRIYLAAMFRGFGDNAAPIHLASLLLHTGASYLVLRVIRRLTGRAATGLAVALLYAAAVAVHQENLVWAAAAYDLGGAVFSLWSFDRFLAQRRWASVALFVVALLFKESLVALPLVFAFHVWLGARPRSAAMRALWPFAAVMLAYAAVKATGISPRHLPPDHPYFLSVGGHALRNVWQYACWMLQSFAPIGTPDIEGFRLAANDALLVLAAALWLGLRGRAGAVSMRVAALLAAWSALSLAPVLCLPNHTYRYYAGAALPGFIGLTCLAAQMLFVGTALGRRRVAAAVLSAILAADVVQSNRVLRQGCAQHTLSDGTGLLVRRACLVRVVRRGLLRELPHPPDGAVILLGGVDLWAFDKDAGPREWLRNDTLKVYRLESLRRDRAGLYLESPPETQIQAYTRGFPDVRLAGGPVYAFRLSGEDLIPVVPDAPGGSP